MLSAAAEHVSTPYEDCAMCKGATQHIMGSAVRQLLSFHASMKSTCYTHCCGNQVEELYVVSSKRCPVPWSIGAVRDVAILGNFLLLLQIHRFDGDGGSCVVSGTAAGYVQLLLTKSSILVPDQGGTPYHQYPARGATISEDPVCE
ncbi:unspecified product [Leishmania tarentolae]|uniref:Unspecified product n=1 Tax=Leishmania tarentolae TaxID=5689 RepID=A0A640KDT5_LEITA|nr:unspecified product [Leishmania tarentolae]